MSKPTTVTVEERIAAVMELRAAYPTFLPFLHDMMQELGFTTSQIQNEIAEFLENGPDYLMVQAQRGQAKTTITAIFAVWSLIHNTKLRILIISAGEAMANEISTLIVKLITNVDILWPLVPDKSAGDRTSVEAFDVHYELKGIDKSPSVACFGIMGGANGKRADLLIADDIESNANSDTQPKREKLLERTRDFTSMNTDGRIIYLGTPQSTDSIYNTLPGRGFTVRVWPGRLPNAKQLEHYADTLAPSIRKLAEARPDLATGHGLDGQQGIALDPRITEEVLIKKELDQGPAYFQLQHMLLTALMDAFRYPLKTSNVILARFNMDQLPLTVVRNINVSTQIMRQVGTKKFLFSTLMGADPAVAKAVRKIAYIDPAGGGQNADETALAYGGLLNSTIFIRGVHGFPGGYDEEKLKVIAENILAYEPETVYIEKNFGYGAFTAVFAPILHRTFTDAGKIPPGIEDDMVSGQKERRIIATLEPVMGRGSLVFHEDIIQEEAVTLSRYDLRVRYTYSLIHQLALLTRDKDSLFHDDRLDAVEGVVRKLSAGLTLDANKREEEERRQQLDKWLANPMGHGKSHMMQQPTANNFMSRIRRL